MNLFTHSLFVVLLVILVTLAHEEVMEEFTEVRVVRFAIKIEGTGVIDEDTKLIREPMTEKISWSIIFSVMWLYFCFLVAASENQQHQIQQL